jgi:CRISPR-associated endonuclease Cas2
MGKEITKRARIGSIQQQILTVLLAGTAFGLLQSPVKQWRILTQLPGELRKVKRNSLWVAAKKLYESRMVTAHKQTDGTYALTLTKKGEKSARANAPLTISVKHQNQWDGKWRIVMFDVPIHMNKIRDGFRKRLRMLGFHELQKSVFVHAYPCTDAITELAHFFDVEENVCIITAVEVSNSESLKKLFRL